MRSASVAPVLLNEDDSRILLELFVAYRIRAKQKSDTDQGRTRDGRASWITAKQAQDFAGFFDEISSEPEQPSPSVRSNGIPTDSGSLIS